MVKDNDVDIPSLEHDYNNAEKMEEDDRSTGNGALDVFTLSGGLSKDWKLPSVLHCLSRGKKMLQNASEQQHQRRRGGAGAGGGAGGVGGREGGSGAAEGSGMGRVEDGEGAGSISSFFDVKAGCLLEGNVSPRPFTQEVCVANHLSRVDTFASTEGYSFCSSFVIFSSEGNNDTRRQRVGLILDGGGG